MQPAGRDVETTDERRDLLVDVVERVVPRPDAGPPDRAVDRADAAAPPQRHEGGGVAIVVAPDLGGIEPRRRLAQGTILMRRLRRVLPVHAAV